MKVISTTHSACGRVSVQVRQDDIWGEYYTCVTVDGQLSKIAPAYCGDNAESAQRMAGVIARDYPATLAKPMALVDKG